MDNLCTTVALSVAVCYGLYYYFKRKLEFFAKHGIPYLPGLPLLGNMGPFVFRRKHMNDVVVDMYNCHPDAKYVGAFDFNVSPLIVLRDLELIKSVTIKNFDDFPDHKAFVDATVDPFFGGNLFNMAGDRWREARSMLSPAFTSSKMKAMYELMVACGKNFVDHLDGLPQNSRRMVATKDLFTRYTSDVIGTCAFGIQVDSLKDPDNKFYKYGREATNFEGLLTVKFFIGKAAPKLLKMFNVKFVKEHIAAFFADLVGDAVAHRDKNGLSRPDMIQLMMDARGKGAQRHLKLDVTEMTAQAFIFFFGGFDSTSTQMCIIAHQLAIDQEVQRRLQEEIDEVLKSCGEGKLEPTYEAVNAMPYLDAVFNESMRLHSQVGFLDRLCAKAFELPPATPGAKPFTVQPGMNVWIPISGVHRDPKYYENPEKFDPERFYKKKVTINDATYLGFGIGPRSCIGNRFAILEVKILFFFLLSRFDLQANEKTSNPFVYSKKSFTVTAEGGYWLTIEPRKNKPDCKD